MVFNTMKKYSATIVFLFLSVSICIASCGKNADKIAQLEENNIEDQNNQNGTKMKITVGDKVFTVTLEDNATAKAFKTLLPFSINMSELNGNEKYFDLSESLALNSTNPGTIRNGDLMLYGSRTLVLFYKSFSTSYRYTRIGRIDNVSGLAEALGSGNVIVKYE